MRLLTVIRNQLLLRQTSVRMTASQNRRQQVDLNIQRTLHLRERSASGQKQGTSGPEPHTPFHGGSRRSQNLVDISHLQAELDGQREEIERIDTAGFQIVAAFDKAVVRIEQQANGLNESIVALQKQLDTKVGGCEDDVSSLKADLRDVKLDIQTELKSRIDSLERTASSLASEIKSLVQLAAPRTELAAVKSELTREVGSLKNQLNEMKKIAADAVNSNKAYAKEIASLREELRQTKQRVDETLQRPEPKAVFPARELEILTKNISKIGSRASHVETLEMEFQLLKGRVQRLEGTKSIPSPEAKGTDNRIARPPVVEGDEMDLLPASSSPPLDQSRRKRTATSANHETPSKKKQAVDPYGDYASQDVLSTPKARVPLIKSRRVTKKLGL